MIRPDQIPEDVWHTAMSTYHKAIRKRPGTAWQEAIAAALNAWPALEICYFLPQGRTITLPFPNVSKYPRKEGDK